MIRGVCWIATNRRWRASLAGYGSNGYIGEYLTEAEAAFARLNFPAEAFAPQVQP